jgi:hypothetical protein
MHVYFPGMVFSINTSTDWHLSYEPLGMSTTFSPLHYVQPRCAPTTYLTKRSTFRALPGPAAPPSLYLLGAPVVIEDDISTSSLPFPPSAILFLHQLLWQLGLMPLGTFLPSFPPVQNVPLRLQLRHFLPMTLAQLLKISSFCHIKYWGNLKWSRVGTCTLDVPMFLIVPGTMDVP